jgi:hypothetical protein
LSEVEGLLKSYERFVRLPWEQGLAGPQKVWFAIYDPTHERRLRLRLSEFEVATKKAGHTWKLVDLTETFATWMAGHDYREAYFEQPEDMDLALEEYLDFVTEQLKFNLTSPEISNSSLVALLGVSSLFGLARVSTVVERVVPEIRGRLLVFFPGQVEGNNYRLLDARDGWNYLAVPITANEEK